MQIADLIGLQHPFAFAKGPALGEIAGLRQSLYGDDAASWYAVGAIERDGKAYRVTSFGFDPRRGREDSGRGCGLGLRSLCHRRLHPAGRAEPYASEDEA